MTDPAPQTEAGLGYVALTFDDGPWDNTAELLETLKGCGLRATLFNWGEHAAAAPDMVKAEVAAGHWVQNHSYTHSHMLTLSPAEMREELVKTQQILMDNGAPEPNIFRPPYGERNEILEAAAAGLGLLTLNWDVDSEDWNQATTEAIVAASERLQPGDVMLMHDWCKPTIPAIPLILESLARRGLRPGMIDPVTGRAVAPK